MKKSDIEEQQPAAVKFARDKDKYVLATSGKHERADVYPAKFVSDPTSENKVSVGIKIVSLDKLKDILALTRGIHEAQKWDHENLVKVYCSFSVENQLWTIMTPLHGFSLRSMIRSSFQYGLPLNTVAFVLKETLKAMVFLHEKNRLYEGLGADSIFLDEKCSTVKLAIFPMNTCDREQDPTTVLSNGLPNWMMDPELISDPMTTSNMTTDVWMFGILSLELLFGRVPADDFYEFKELIASSLDHNYFGQLRNKNYVRDHAWSFLGIKFKVSSCFGLHEKKIPNELGEVIAACLSTDPKKRPTMKQLMEFKFFKDCNPRPETVFKKLKNALNN